MSMKNSNDTIGKRTRDVPVCRAVPQRTAPPRAPLLSKNIKIKTYRTIVLTVVFYERKTWSLTLREEHRLRVFENRVLRRIFGPKRDEVTGEWRKLHN
jgi:hypothetical protein